MLYIIGGFDGNTTVNRVECYDPETKKMQEMWPMSVSRRSALGACVVPGLPNAKSYSWLRREIEEENQAKKTTAQQIPEVFEASSPVARRTRRRRRMSQG
jgi:hypothetical protein